MNKIIPTDHPKCEKIIILKNSGTIAHKLTREDRVKGGRAKSLRKTIANSIKGLKHGRKSKLVENRTLTCQICPPAYREFCPTYRLREERKELELVCLMRGKLLDIIKAFSTGDPNLLKGEKTKLFIDALTHFKSIADPERKGHADLKLIKAIKEDFEPEKINIEHTGSVVMETDFKRILTEIREANKLNKAKKDETIMRDGIK